MHAEVDYSSKGGVGGIVMKIVIRFLGIVQGSVEAVADLSGGTSPVGLEFR